MRFLAPEATPHWHLGENAGGEEHVWPCGDAREHDGRVDGNCWCSPTVSLTQGVEGGDLWRYVHHAADGRPYADPLEEATEPTGRRRHLIVFDLFSLSLTGGIVGLAGFAAGWLVKRR